MESKPFFEACAAEGVEAIEEGERVVEHFGADLIKKGQSKLSLGHFGSSILDIVSYTKLNQQGGQGSLDSSHHSWPCFT